MTDTQLEVQTVTYLLMLRDNGYPAFSVAQKTARQSVGTDAMRQSGKGWRQLYTAIEDSLEQHINLVDLGRERKIPYNSKAIIKERQKYCRAYLGSLRAIPPVNVLW